MADGDGGESVREILIKTRDELDAFREEMNAGHARTMDALADLRANLRATPADAEPTDAND